MTSPYASAKKAQIKRQMSVKYENTHPEYYIVIYKNSMV